MNRISVLAAAAASMMAQAWQDPAKHQVATVKVEEGVQIEVLDFGGSGKPMVLIPGYFSGHVYDDFAPKLTNAFHVYSISRRGYGASSRPENGYTADRRAEDVRMVLDALKLPAAVLAGQGPGADDATAVAVKYPEKVAAVVYLNSAEDPTLGMADFGVKAVDARKLPAAMRTPPRPDLSSFDAYRAWQMKTQNISFPESELRQIFKVKPDGSLGPGGASADIRQSIIESRKKPEYDKIKAPVIAFYATPAPIEEQVKKYQPANDAEKAAMEEVNANNLTIQKRHHDDLKKGVPNAKIVDISGGNFYIFASHGDQIAKEIAAFAGK